MPERRPHSTTAGRRQARSSSRRPSARSSATHAALRRPSGRPSVKGRRVGAGTPSSLGSGMGLGSMGGAPAGGGSPVLTRRRFLYGALGVGAVGVLAAGGAAIAGAVGGSSDESGADRPSALSVPASAVTVLSADSETFSQTAEDAPLVQNVGSYDLPFGTLVWSGNDVNAACLIPTDSADPLTTVGVLSLSSGSLTTVLEQAQDHAAGFDVYDARCSAAGLVWTEANILQGVWRVWAAPLNEDGTLGARVQLDEGDGAWETPSIAAAGNAAFWQCVPTADGPAASANSCVKRAAFGSSDVGVVCESSGRMATPLSATADAVVCTPRAAGSGTYYQLTLVDAASGAVSDQVTLPAGMRPLEAGYGPTGFTFCFEAGYDFGDGISGVGTYAPTTEGAPYDYSGRQWFCFSRTPSTGAAWCGDCVVVKSTSSVAVVDPAASLYTSILAESEADDWGEQLASTGNGSLVVTYQHIDADGADASTDEGAGTTASASATSASHCCRVRVWAAASGAAASADGATAEDADGNETADENGGDDGSSDGTTPESDGIGESADGSAEDDESVAPEGRQN